MIIYLALVAALGWAYIRLPTAFVPNEDQGYLIVDIQTPPEASANRTLAVIKQIEDIFLADPAVARVFAISGFSFSGAGAERGPRLRAAEGLGRARRGEHRRRRSRRAPTPSCRRSRTPRPSRCRLPRSGALAIPAGFTFRLQDRGGVGQAGLSAARDQMLTASRNGPIARRACASRVCRTRRRSCWSSTAKRPTPSASPSADINTTISANLGSSYVNDFPNAGRMQRVTVQAEAGPAHADQGPARTSTSAMRAAAWCRSQLSRASNG